MPVLIDHAPLAVEGLGYRTVGQVLSHLARDNRLVVNVLIDGQEPDLGQMTRLRSVPLGGQTIFIETTDPHAMAAEVLGQVGVAIDDSLAAASEAVTHFQTNRPQIGLQKLGQCFTLWQHVHESIEKTAQLLRIDLDRVRTPVGTMAEMLRGLSSQLRDVRAAIEARDFVLLCDVLDYDMPERLRDWRDAVGQMAACVCTPVGC